MQRYQRSKTSLICLSSFLFYSRRNQTHLLSPVFLREEEILLAPFRRSQPPYFLPRFHPLSPLQIPLLFFKCYLYIIYSFISRPLTCSLFFSVMASEQQLSTIKVFVFVNSWLFLLNIYSVGVAIGDIKRLLLLFF